MSLVNSGKAQSIGTFAPSAHQTEHAVISLKDKSAHVLKNSKPHTEVELQTQIETTLKLFFFLFLAPMVVCSVYVPYFTAL